MSQCNYCSLKRLRESLKGTGSRVFLRRSNFMHGVDVFVVPKGESLGKYVAPNDKYPNGDEMFQKYHRMWFMKIGDRCEC